jgi:Uncharacterised nucleotidyltransferase
VSDGPRPSITRALRDPHALASCNLQQWEALVREARRTNLLSRLALGIAECDLLGRVPPAPRAHLVAAQALAQAQSDAIRREVTYIRSALARVGIDIVLLKGAAYLIAGLPAARGRLFTDVDILVPFERLPEVEAALLLHGWFATHHGAYDQRYYREWMHELPPLRHAVRTTIVDVHHAILPRTARLKPSSAKLLAASRPIPGEDRLRVLSPADLVLHSATHLFLNEELSQGLRDLADLDSLLRHFGGDPEFWNELPRRAVELDLARPLHYGLRHASRLLGTPVPDAARSNIQRLAPPPWLDGIMGALYEQALRPVAPGDPGLLTPLARQALFLRAHWLRMPPMLLTRHLVSKILRIDRDGDHPRASADI